MTRFDYQNMQWFPVRCCCRPELVFGFIRLPSAMAPCKVMLRRIDSQEQYEATLDVFSESKITSFDSDETKADRGYVQEIAVRSDDKPIEFWRNVEGFIEAARQMAPWRDITPRKYGGPGR